MDTALPLTLAALIAYLIGSIPFGFLMAKSKGVDIRTVGSGNIGATNVFRALGKSLGITTFVLDIGKGTLAVTLLPLALAAWPIAGETVLQLLCAIAVVAGHNWPVWLKFKGGKGVATSAGVMIGLAPLGVLIAFGVWLVVLLISRYVSLSSIAAAVALAITAWLLYRADGWLLPGALSFLAAVVILRHKSNIARLMAGTENRFDFKKKKKIEKTPV